jgi:hypothetical protein
MTDDTTGQAESTHDIFEKKMAEKYPRYFGEGKQYGGFAIGEGWYPIIEALIGQIDHYTKWRRNTRAHQLHVLRAKAKGRDAVLTLLCKGKTPSDYAETRADDIMDYEQDPTVDRVDWIRVAQIKEKFGGLRFYYDGGDDHISGMVTMAEVWAGRTCETCGNVGKQRGGGWIRTLCDQHEAEYQARKNHE